jgi:hypothetical protein
MAAQLCRYAAGFKMWQSEKYFRDRIQAYEIYAVEFDGKR